MISISISCHFISFISAFHLLVPSCKFNVTVCIRVCAFECVCELFYCLVFRFVCVCACVRVCVCVCVRVCIACMRLPVSCTVV